MSKLGDVIAAKIKAQNAAYDRLKQSQLAPEDDEENQFLNNSLTKDAMPKAADPETQAIQNMATEEGLPTADLNPDDMETRREFMRRSLTSPARGHKSRLLSMR